MVLQKKVVHVVLIRLNAKPILVSYSLPTMSCSENFPTYFR